MAQYDRRSEVRTLLWQHAHPTLRSMDFMRISKLTDEIVEIMDHRSVWTKWGKDREEIARRAADMCIPMEDLREALNAMPGPELTKVDVEQRIRDIREAPYGSGYPPDSLAAESFAVFAEEKAKGTEFIALLGYMEDWSYGATERLRLKAEKERREHIEEDKRNAETRLRNGVDCPWTTAADIPDLHCRKNGRLYRLHALKPTSKFEPAFEVLRVDNLDAKRGRIVGRYRTRGEATKAVANVAYQEDDL